ncbi:hypothetical protein [Eubacterium ventriosum]|uniref:hypothetical protein n=1 Tax=Eubacterium ventriosum TaxID=39496 RepID=UPI002E76305B|nr:hypothetical protein [Eubacterium ventriosum]MEE0854787.1 hypothetical protein [Eubacterium ventriosum]
MAKKVRFSLEMKNGVEVTDLESLKENFDIEKVKQYMIDGRLLTWLQDRYYEDEADEVEELDEEDRKLGEKLCEIFEVPYDPREEQSAEMIERLNKLKEYTCNEEVLNHVTSVAFSQEELADLLDEEEEVIYLCGDRFSIPLSKTNTTYIGVNEPIVTYKNKKNKNLDELGIKFAYVKFDEGVVNTPQVAEIEKTENKNYNEEQHKDEERLEEYPIILFAEKSPYKGSEYRCLYMNDPRTGMDVKISEERKDSVVDYCNSKEYVFYAFENDNNIMRYNIRTGETMIIPTKLKGKMGLVYKEDSLFNMFEKVDYFEERKRKEEEYKKTRYNTRRCGFVDQTDSNRTNGKESEFDRDISDLQYERTMFCGENCVIVRNPENGKFVQIGFDGNSQKEISILGNDETCAIGWIHKDIIYYCNMGTYMMYNLKTRVNQKIKSEDEYYKIPFLVTDGECVCYPEQYAEYKKNGEYIDSFYRVICQNMDGTDKKVVKDRLNTSSSEVKAIVINGNKIKIKQYSKSFVIEK